MYVVFEGGLHDLLAEAVALQRVGVEALALAAALLVALLQLLALLSVLRDVLPHPTVILGQVNTGHISAKGAISGFED